jgi:enoyl-[acyl-carrier-protein] reductase (NADH)
MILAGKTNVRVRQNISDLAKSITGGTIYIDGGHNVVN